MYRISVPLAGSAVTTSYIAPAMRSIVPKRSMCCGPIAVTMAMRGCTRLLIAAISPGA